MANIVNPKNKILKRGYHRITLDFGNTYKDGSFHKGCDFTGNTSVDDGYDYIVAVADGVVTSCQNNINGVVKDTGTAGMGNYVYIEHENGYRSRYQHMKKGSVTVKKGDKVKAGQVIGYMGSTGNSTGRHLHFDLSAPGKVSGGTYVSSQNRTYFDPKPYIMGTKTLCNEKVSYFKKYTGKSTSIVDALNSMGIKSTFSYRKEIANANSIKPYSGLPAQNQKMLSLLKQGKLIKP